MKNFIFKSSAEGFGLVKKLISQNEIILTELRHQRNDHVTLQHDFERLRTDLNLQRQADSYYEDHKSDTGEAHLGLDAKLEDTTE